MLESTTYSNRLASQTFSALPAAPRQAARALLDALMLEEQTINLSALIQRFSDCDLLEVDIEGDGYCLPAGLLSKKTLVVVPAKGQGEARRRFTMAHELGHIACHYQARRVTDEEQWCDTFASELLMPKERVLAFSKTARTLADWLRFPDHFKVSRPAAARKMWDYCSVVMITDKLDAKPGDARYDGARRELIALALGTQGAGDTYQALSDGSACLIRRRRNQGYDAVAKL